MNEKIRHAYDSIHPTDEQKNRMLRNIVTKMPAEMNRYKAVPTESRFLPVLVTAVLLVLVVFAAVHYFGAPENPVQLADPTQTEEVPDETRLSQDGITETRLRQMLEEREFLHMELKEREVFFQILLKYTTAIDEDWDFDRCEAEKISYMTGFVTTSLKLGYSFMDLDDNGTMELIISDGNVIFDLYTLENGELKHLLSGGERDTYELCEGNYICNIGSNGAGSTTYQYFKLNGSELLKEVSLVYEANAESENWYLMGSFQYSLQRIPVDADRAAEIIDSYQIVPIEITTFE